MNKEKMQKPKLQKNHLSLESYLFSNDTPFLGYDQVTEFQDLKKQLGKAEKYRKSKKNPIPRKSIQLWRPIGMTLIGRIPYYLYLQPNQNLQKAQWLSRFQILSKNDGNANIITVFDRIISNARINIDSLNSSLKPFIDTQFIENYLRARKNGSFDENKLRSKCQQLKEKFLKDFSAFRKKIVPAKKQNQGTVTQKISQPNQQFIKQEYEQQTYPEPFQTKSSESSQQNIKIQGHSLQFSERSEQSQFSEKSQSFQSQNQSFEFSESELSKEVTGVKFVSQIKESTGGLRDLYKISFSNESDIYLTQTGIREDDSVKKGLMKFMGPLMKLCKKE